MQQQKLSEQYSSSPQDDLSTRLLLGSHIAQYLRLSLEETQGYTSTVGISTNKLLSKLVGNVNKPKGQTTLLPPYTSSGDQQSNVFAFLDPHDISKIPGIGSSIARKLRGYINSQPSSSTSLPYNQHPYTDAKNEPLLLSTIRTLPSLSPSLLENILGGPGTERGIGGKIYNFIHGIDDTEVQFARKVPRQISIEDSYIKLNTLEQVRKELAVLTRRVVERMRVDLVEVDDGEEKWLAHPKTIRLSTRPRPPFNSDGSRSRSFTRISRSAPLPSYVFNTKDPLDIIVGKLVSTTLLPMFKYLHPQKNGWDLSLVNVAVTNMEETTTAKGGDLKSLFAKGKEKREWDVEDRDVPPDEMADIPEDVPDIPNVPDGSGTDIPHLPGTRDMEQCEGSEDHLPLSQQDEGWYDSTSDCDDESAGSQPCTVCGLMLPGFAMDAHERWHVLEGG
jgi:DNA polymerase iota